MDVFWTRGAYNEDMDKAPARPQHLFIVRLWSEAVEPTPAGWRGSVEHVASGQKLYFTALADLSDFIALRLAGLDDPGPLKIGKQR